MSRLLLLILFLTWLMWESAAGTYSLVGTPPDVTKGMVIFLGGYVVLILAMGIWSRRVAEEVSAATFHRSLRRFNKMMGVARVLIPVWFAFALCCLGWHKLVEDAVGWLEWFRAKPSGTEGASAAAVEALMKSPAAVVGTLPAFLAWAGLWWSQYPADRALREQNLLLQLEADVPLHAPPGFWSYFASNLRLQLLFILAPIFALMVLRDAVAVGWYLATKQAPPEWVEFGVSVGSFGFVFVLAPVLLTRVLKTESLPDGELRRRLDQMCRQHGLKYRDILLWHTESNMGNAAVMGILPRLRYVLLSDLLLETMTDEQIEAVFAHELGHIVYKHMLWYVVFLVSFLFALSGPGGTLYEWVLPLLVDEVKHPRVVDGIGIALSVLGVGAFFTLFGFVSRRCERQADVFAARVMEQILDGRERIDDAAKVGARGAGLFASALHRVAAINNIPIATRSWCHGSIEKRMRYVNELGNDPARTAVFDKMMGRMYLAILVSLVVFGIWQAVTLRKQGFNEAAVTVGTGAATVTHTMGR